MKILIASDLYWPVINGVSSFSRNLAKGLASRGHEVVVIAPSQNGKKYQEVDGNYTVMRTATVIFPFYQNYRISLTPYAEVKRIINEFQPDVIHIQMLLMIGQATMRYGNKQGYPIVSTNHAMPENLMDNLRLLTHFSRPINSMLKRYGVKFYAKSDYVTMPTQAAIDMYKTEKQHAHLPIEAVSNGIDLSRFKPTKAPTGIYKKFNIPTNKPIITFVGRVDAEKHVPVLVRAFAKVAKKTDARLLIVGDGTDMEVAKQTVKECGLGKKVILTGRVTDEEISLLHKVTTVFCMPSPAELQSIVTLEAMASGKPVVVVDGGAVKELCHHGVNGFICHQDDETQIAEAITKIITDDKLWAKMSAESLKIAESHSLEKTLDRFEEIYKQVIKSKKL